MTAEIVAELSNAHNGSIDRALRLIDAAKAAGADALKFQCYTPDELVALRGDGPAPAQWGQRGWTMRSLYEVAQTPHEWFPALVRRCEAVGIPWFSSVFGPTSLALLEQLDCPRYKLAALDFGKVELREMVERTGKPVIRSCNDDVPPPSKWIRVWCPPGYPQKEFRLRNLRNGYEGFSYHGTDYRVPVVAATLGAQFIECHFHLRDEPSELEANVSLDETQFARMVREIRKMEAML